MATTQHVSFSTQVLAGPVPAGPDWDIASTLLRAARESHGDPVPILSVLASSGQSPPTPGTGQTATLWEFLATLASLDLAAARTVEPHLDAAAILAQASIPWTPRTTWGVYAAEGGTGLRASARDDARGWTLEGHKPWCSLAGQLDRAVVTAHVDSGRRAYVVDLRHPGVRTQTGSWASHGLAWIPSEAVDFTAVPAHPVGPAEWYLQRPGFAVGGVGVAACWFGGAVGLFRTLYRSARNREPDQLALAWLGEADRLLSSAAAMLLDAAGQADRETLDLAGAQRVRGHVAEICERLLATAGHAMGPGPLGFDPGHARRVADLGIYLRQHHSSRDDATLGALLLKDAEGGDGPW